MRKGQRLVINNSAHICVIELRIKSNTNRKSLIKKKPNMMVGNFLQNIKLGDGLIPANLPTRFMIQETRVRLSSRLNMGTMTPH